MGVANQPVHPHSGFPVQRKPHIPENLDGIMVLMEIRRWEKTFVAKMGVNGGQRRQKLVKSDM